MTKKTALVEPSTNRRGEPRFPGNGQIRYLPARAAKDWRFLNARLLNFSGHGIAIEAPESMDIGDDFIVKVRIGKIRLVVYRVQNTVRGSRGYRIGGEFLGFLSDPDEVDHDLIVEALSGLGIRNAG